MTIDVEGPSRGLARIEVELVQNGWRRTIAERAHVPQKSWAPWEKPTTQDQIKVTIGSDDIPNLSDGEATIRVIAARANTWLKRLEPVTAERNVSFQVTPPQITVISHKVPVEQGGAAVVIYDVSERATKHSVKVGERLFGSFAVPKAPPGRRFAFFAIPYDMGTPAPVVITAEDDVGNDAEAIVDIRFEPKPFRQDTLHVTRDVMAQIVPKIIAETPDFVDRGELVKNYIAMNSDLRKSNAERIKAVTKESAPAFLWKKAFAQMPAKVFGSFADRRTYLHEGKTIDRQDHLGFDLASTKNAAVPAANNGVVVLAEHLGIYGHCVVIDHGFGLASLYAHLSEIEVATGARVLRNQRIGRTGSSGLALGDHLHFTMLLNGLAVNPLQWWNERWVERHIAQPLGDALPFERLDD